ncbi:MAG: hypothetical protein M3121_04250 [Chloroflexota bacterium]|nr:hypothetical protein [Chloroflexota bacterium]
MVRCEPFGQHREWGKSRGSVGGLEGESDEPPIVLFVRRQGAATNPLTNGVFAESTQACRVRDGVGRRLVAGLVRGESVMGRHHR